MVFILKQIEVKKEKLLNLFPVTSTHIPGHVQIDSTTLAHLFNIKYNGKLSDNHKLIWSQVFQLKRKSFKSFKGKGTNNKSAAPKYLFAYSIKTDGVSVSCLHRRTDLYTNMDDLVLPVTDHQRPPMEIVVENEDNEDEITNALLENESESENESDNGVVENEIQLAFKILTRFNHHFAANNIIDYRSVRYLLGPDIYQDGVEVKTAIKKLRAWHCIDLTIMGINQGIELSFRNINNLSITIEFLRDQKIKHSRLKYIRKRHPKKKKQEIQYLDDIVKNKDLVEKWNLKKRKKVGVDPGKVDLISCADGRGKDAKLFRYTQLQRMKEMQTKRNIAIRKHIVNSSGLTIEHYEQRLSEMNSKSLDYNVYKVYFDLKMIYIAYVKDFYGDTVFRKLRLQSYQNKRKSESRMINNFKKIYGNPWEVMICIGDYGQKEHMKYRPPSIGKGIRDIFRRHGYLIFLIDEFRTSMRCAVCHGENEQFEYHLNKKKKPKPEDVELGYRRPFRERVLSRGLLRCTNVECGHIRKRNRDSQDESFNRLWNRDVNAAKNIFYLAELIMSDLPRIPELSRNVTNQQAESQASSSI